MNFKQPRQAQFWKYFQTVSVQRFWVPFLSICMFTFLIWQNFLCFEYLKYFTFWKKKVVCVQFRWNCWYFEKKCGQKKKKQEIQKNQNFFILLKWPYYFSKLKISQNDLPYSIVHFNIFPKWPCNNFCKPCGRCNGRWKSEVLRVILKYPLLKWL